MRFLSLFVALSISLAGASAAQVGTNVRRRNSYLGRP